MVGEIQFHAISPFGPRASPINSVSIRAAGFSKASHALPSKRARQKFPAIRFPVAIIASIGKWVKKRWVQRGAVPIFLCANRSLLSAGSANRANTCASATLDAGSCVDHIFAVTSRDRVYGALSLACAAADALIRNCICHGLHLLKCSISLYHRSGKNQSIFHKIFVNELAFSQSSARCTLPHKTGKGRSPWAAAFKKIDSHKTLG